MDYYRKYFVTDVACGDYHSCVLTNSKEAYVWGSNKEGQLGMDMENYSIITKPTKIVVNEYMNSVNVERFITIKA